MSWLIAHEVNAIEIWLKSPLDKLFGELVCNCCVGTRTRHRAISSVRLLPTARTATRDFPKPVAAIMLPPNPLRPSCWVPLSVLHLLMPSPLVSVCWSLSSSYELSYLTGLTLRISSSISSSGSQHLWWEFCSVWFDLLIETSGWMWGVS